MEPEGTLDAMLENVSDEKSLLKFIEALISDRIRTAEGEKRSLAGPWGPGSGGWENTSIEHFLESAVAWAADTNFGLDQGLSESNPWKRFALFLFAGKIYE